MHNELDVLGLKTGVVDLFAIILFFLLLLLNSLALAVVVVVVMAGVVVSSVLSVGELLGCGSLSLGVQVLNLSLAEDAVVVLLRAQWRHRGLLTSKCYLKGTCRRRAG